MIYLNVPTTSKNPPRISIKTIYRKTPTQSPQPLKLHAREPWIPPGLPVLPVVLPDLLAAAVREPPGLVRLPRLLPPFPAVALRVLQLRLELLGGAQVPLLQRALVGAEPRVGGRERVRVRPQLVELHREPREAVVALVVGRHGARAPYAARGRRDAAVQRLRPFAEQLADRLAGLVVDRAHNLEVGDVTLKTRPIYLSVLILSYAVSSDTKY